VNEVLRRQELLLVTSCKANFSSRKKERKDLAQLKEERSQMRVFYAKKSLANRTRLTLLVKNVSRNDSNNAW
jgi:hypothetical protein